ncbi:MAG TPA: hypothetical protein VKB18_01155 [Gemmatimonadota bacterium]|nr:hypothetical protein [Gemmatimonadota bacterium]
MRIPSRKLASGALLALALPVLAGAGDHITPTVVLKKQAEVIKATLPGASSFFLKKVEIGKRDLSRIEQSGGFEPESPDVKFYYGQDGSGSTVGVVLFPQVNTQHGPFEVGLTMGPDGTVRDVTLTKATVETKPWVEKAAGTGFLEDFRGLGAGQAPTTALERLRSADIGKMPTYSGKQVAKAVEHGLTLYGILYAGSGRAAGGSSGGGP